MENKKTSFPRIVRVAFGNCFSNREMAREVENAVKTDKSGAWDSFGGQDNVSYYVLGKDNADRLVQVGAKNVRLVDGSPLIHDPKVSFWYNKTFLILAAFKDWGMDAEVLYVDCDVQITRRPDAKMASLLRGRWSPKRRILSPVRLCKHPKRIPLLTRDRQELKTCPCNCLMYCRDGKAIEEHLPLYAEIASKYGSDQTIHWTGTPTTGWDDESVSMYCFDKSEGKKTLAEIVDAFEPESVIRLQRHPPAEATAMKKDGDLYLVHH